MIDLDVVIVGAGLSGVGAAVHLQKACPEKTYALLESRDAIGGTWDLYRYPGIRSDSDMHTLGYAFKPWRSDTAIADGPAIRDYVRETAAEHGVDRHVRFGHRLERADWSTEEACWRLFVARSDGRGTETIRARFLVLCSGYYSYDRPYRPHFEGEESFEGPMFHPQHWPETLDHRDQRIVVIGSGATAMTLVPALAEKAAHVTMLQRSPTYVIARPARDRLANGLRKLLGERLAYRITRFKNVQIQRLFYRRTRTAPEKVKASLLKRVRDRLGDDYVEKHFTPSYDPWDQRLCLLPDGDLFDAIESGRASVVTDRIDCITKRGIRLESGEELAADLIVVATGLRLQLLGGATFSVDGEQVDFSKTWTYKGLMHSGVPNLIQTFGYVNASWTLRADLTADYTGRLLRHMDRLGMRQCTPRLRPEDRDMPARPWIEGFSAGYMQRAMPDLPRQGDRMPWRNPQDPVVDRKMIRDAPIEDGALVFGNPAPSRAE